MTKPDCFGVLNIPLGATPEEARRAYMRLVRRWHPDRFTDDPKMQDAAQEKLKRINAAYQEVKRILSAKEKPEKTAEPMQPENRRQTNATTPEDPEKTAAGKRTFFQAVEDMVPGWFLHFFSSKTAGPSPQQVHVASKKTAKPSEADASRDFKTIFNDAVRARGPGSHGALKHPGKRRGAGVRPRGQRPAARGYGPVLPLKKRGDIVEPVSPVKRVGKVK